MHYANVARHNKLKTVLKCTYFMAVIDGVFYLDAPVIHNRETLSVVTFEWSKINAQNISLYTFCDFCCFQCASSL